MKTYKQDLNEIVERPNKLFFLAVWKMLKNLAEMTSGKDYQAIGNAESKYIIPLFIQVSLFIVCFFFQF